MTSPLKTAVSVPFRAVAAARGARAVHPQGFLCRGTWKVSRTSSRAPGAAVLKAGAAHPCLIRVSRGAGLPEQVGDFLGIAVRIQDAYGEDRHQDILINTSADLPVVHHVFLPASRWFAQSYSTCLPYRAGAGNVVLGLVPPDEEGPGPSLDAMRRAVASGQVRFGIAVAGSLQRWEQIGELRLHDPLTADRGDVDFDPIRFTGGGLEPSTWLNRLRTEAYRQSRRGRGAPDEPRLEPTR